MSKETYSIPTGPTARYDFQRNAVTLALPNVVVWNIPSAKINAIAPLRSNYELKYALTNNKSTQSPGATAARDAAWDLYVVALIDLYNSLLNNPAIAPVDKDALHIHSIGGNSTTPTPAPTTTPIITLVSEEISILHVVYADSSAPNTHYKPANVAFCEICYKIGEPAPTGIADTPERYNISRSHEGMVFTPDQRGKTIYAYARWVNKNGKFGPWSSLVAALIP